MRLNVTKTDLSNALQLVSRAVSPKGSMPILGCVYMGYSDGKLTLKSTDLEMGIQAEIPVEEASEDAENFEIVVQARYITELAKRLPSEDVKLFWMKDKNVLVVISGNSHYTMMTMAAEEFPGIPEEEQTYWVSMKQKRLKEMIRHTTFACSQNDHRVFLSGALIQINPDQMSMVATDSFRMAIYTTKWDFSSKEEDIDIIVPAKALNELMRILQNDEEAWVDMVISRNYVTWTLDNIKFTSRLIDSQYPDYTKFIGRAYNTEIEVDRERLIGAIERASIFSSDNMGGIELNIKEHKFVIVNSTPGVGHSNDCVYGEQLGENCSIGLRWRYLLDVLKICEEEKVKIEFRGEAGPATIRLKIDEGTEYLYVVMPLKI